MTFREFVAGVYGLLALACAYAVIFEAEGPATVWTTAAMGLIFAGVAAGALWWRPRREADEEECG
jgi:uncharacterized membrane protein HdeD (DUF308 family)